MEDKLVYLYSGEYARQQNPPQTEEYRNSWKQNIASKNAIEQAIRENFDGMRLNKETANEVISVFGIERVTFVLANTVQQKDWDGRFSHDNKDWAKSIAIPEDVSFDRDRRCDFVVESHPAVLDGFINQVRRECKEQEQKPSIRKQLEAPQKAAVPTKPAAHKISKDKEAR